MLGSTQLKNRRTFYCTINRECHFFLLYAIPLFCKLQKQTVKIFEVQEGLSAPILQLCFFSEDRFRERGLATIKKIITLKNIF